MPNTAPTLSDAVSASLVAHWLDASGAHGLRRDELQADAGISPEQLSNPDGWLPAATIERLVHAALRRSQNPLLGLTMARHTGPASFGVVGYIMQTCSNLQDAMQMVNRYERLISDIGFTSLRHEPGVALWCWDCKTSDPVFLRQATEYILAAWSSLVRMIRERDNPTLLAVRLRHEPPADPALLPFYEATFHCPVYFNQPESALVLAAAALTLPLSNANASLQETLEQHARNLLQQRKTSSTLREQAKAQLYILLRQGTASRELLAQQLCMSSRSLHRQLHKEGSNYRDLLDELRYEQARQYLGGHGHTVEDIALRLGFQESQSFIRWFRRLAGCTPGEFQKRAGLGL